MESSTEDKKNPSTCCLLVLYNTLFRRRPSPSSPSIPPIQPKSTPKPSPSDLNPIIFNHHRTKSRANLLRASSGNVMLYANLGNLCPPKKNPKEMPSFCRALSRRLDPEELKEMGNDEYNNGRYADALALYDRAILIDPHKACYWSNKAAALIALGRFLDAVDDCREAIRIDASFFRAHHRLANIYVRLGEPKRAANHFKLAKNEASYDDISRAKAMQVLIGKCSEAKNLRDWSILLKESQSAISAGADSSPQIFAYQAEAFLMLRRLEDAEESMIDAPKFETDASTKFFGAPSNAYYLSVRAQVDLAAGKFESAVSLAQMAARIDPGSREIAAVARKTRSVASARSMGNNLFKASKFEEACLAYGDGLRHDPQNAILLCNRAACRSKLGQWQKAIEDCNVALSLRPKYSKARLRRADCNAKLEQWEKSVNDYEVLVLEISGDETMSKALKEAKEHLRRQLVEGITETANGSKVEHITNKDRFHDTIKSSGEFGGKRLLSMVGNCELSP